MMDCKHVDNPPMQPINNPVVAENNLSDCGIFDFRNDPPGFWELNQPLNRSERIDNS